MSEARRVRIIGISEKYFRGSAKNLLWSSFFQVLVITVRAAN
jgi:hypothetical protein